MAGLIEAEFALIHAGRGQHSDRAGNHAGFIRKDVPKHILRENHVKLTGIHDQLHGTIVHQHVGQLHFRVIPGNFLYHLPPQSGGIKDIGLIHAGYFLPALHGNVKGLNGNPSDFLFIICKCVHGCHDAVHFPCIPVPKIKTAGKLPHNHHIKAVPDDLLFQRACLSQFLIKISRPDVSKEPQSLADSQKSRFRPEIGSHIIPP